MEPIKNSHDGRTCLQNVRQDDQYRLRQPRRRRSEARNTAPLNVFGKEKRRWKTGISSQTQEKWKGEATPIANNNDYGKLMDWWPSEERPN